MGQYPDTPTYMEALSGKIVFYVSHYKRHQEDYTALILMVCIDWNIDDVAI